MRLLVLVCAALLAACGQVSVTQNPPPPVAHQPEPATPPTRENKPPVPCCVITLPWYPPHPPTPPIFPPIPPHALGPVTVYWTPPQDNTDGSLIDYPLTYNVYQGAALGEILVGFNVSGTQWQTTVNTHGTVCWAVRAINYAPNQSASSDEFCLFF